MDVNMKLTEFRKEMGLWHMMGNSLEDLTCSWNCTGECIDKEETPPYYAISKERLDELIEQEEKQNDT